METAIQSVEEILTAVKDIPPLPAIIPRVMNVLNDPNCTVVELSEVLGSDQAIASKLLRLSNSAFYGYSKHIGTIQDAVVLLGFKTIKGLIYALSLYSSFNQDVGGYMMEKGELWRHSLTAAFVARTIATRTRAGNPDQAFVCGLMHDIGKTILGEFLGRSTADVLKFIQKDNLNFVEAEERVFGVAHPEIGARVCEKWNLPVELQESVRYHHAPSNCLSGNPLVPVVHVADIVCMMLGVGVGLDGLLYDFDDKALQAIGKDWTFIDDIVNVTGDQLDDIDKLLNL
jgi:putative nucleotidyltransferase with HDIG domain